MKKEGHPPYQEVIFVDSETGKKFLCSTTLSSKETIKHEGKEYPVLQASVTSESHPFYRGTGGSVDSMGRMKKFANRYKLAEEKARERAKAAQENIKAAQEKKIKITKRVEEKASPDKK